MITFITIGLTAAFYFELLAIALSHTDEIEDRRDDEFPISMYFKDISAFKLDYLSAISFFVATTYLLISILLGN